MTEQNKQQKGGIKGFVTGLSRKQMVIGLISLALVGSGSAALVNSFFTATGTATVDTQAVSSDSPTSFSYSNAVPPETFVDSVELTNNNEEAYEDVKFEWDVTATDEEVQKVTVFDVTGNHSEATTTPTDVSYDKEEDEVHFTVKRTSDYSNGNGVVLGFDTDNDGTYDFQVDAASSGIQPDYWAYEDGEWNGLHDYSPPETSGGDGNEEFRGVHFTGSETNLEDKDNFTLTVDAERLGSDFAYDVQPDGGFLQDGDATDAVDSTIGEDVTSTVDSIRGTDSRVYAVVTELLPTTGTGDSGSTDYETTVDAQPLTN